MRPADLTVTVAYDGSANADDAVEQAVRLFPSARIVVVTVWSPAGDVAAARLALPDTLIEGGVHALDAEAERQATETANDGRSRAEAAGAETTAVAVAKGSTTWSTVLAVAEDEQAAAVVVGSRGRSAVRSAVLGSVSNAIVNHSRIPVVVVRRREQPASE